MNRPARAFLKPVVTFCLLLLSSAAAARQLPAGTPEKWLSTVQANIAAGEYNLSRAPLEPGAIYHAPNRANGFRARFDGSGVRLVPRVPSPDGWEWGLEFDAGDELVASVSVSGNRIEYGKGTIKEWFVNGDKGLEHGFTIGGNPSEKGALRDEKGMLKIDLKLAGGLRPVFSDGGQAVDFYHRGIFNVVRYSQLKVTDALGNVLPSRFLPITGGVRISVDDTGAVYPVTIDPLATSPAWSVEGIQIACFYGASVATAGDVNGDGYSDVIIGAPYFDSGETDEGMAFLYYGSASGLSTSAAWSAEGNQVNAFFGISVSSAGDVNGDGYYDVVAGAHAYDNGQTDEGRVFVYHGSPSGLPAGASWSRESDIENAQYGCSVSSAGDVNGDGYSDIVLGAKGYSNGQSYEGAAFVHYGSASGLSGAVPAVLESGQMYAWSGSSVALAGDVNGDGYSDIVIGAPMYDSAFAEEGAAFVFHGSPGGIVPSPSWAAYGNQDGARSGNSVASAGDVNGDGYSDVIVGASYFDNGEADEGSARVFFGSASGLSSSPAWSGEGGQPGAQYGFSAGTAGDVNGDGYADVIVGAPYYDHGESDEGFGYVYLGSSAGLASIPVWTAESDRANGNFGYSAGTAGDVNGDGFSDIVVGAPIYSGAGAPTGRATLYCGSAAGPASSAGWTAESNQVEASLGFSVGTAGDVNGDGYDDVIVGAEGYDNGEVNEGAAFVFHGSASGLGTSPAWTVETNHAGAGFGRSVASAGDVNGDGFADVIIGAPFYDYWNTNSGEAFVFHGSPSGLGTSPTWTVHDTVKYMNLGYSVSTAGDVNGDGYSDVLVGTSFPDLGKVYAYYGSASGLSAAAGWAIQSDTYSSNFGSSVSTAGDVNGDGYSDVIIGAPSHSVGTTYPGRAWVYNGSAAGLKTTADWTGLCAQDGAGYGYSVSGAGDVNGDGYSDVIVGAYRFDNGEADEGAAFVYHGSSSGLSPSPACTMESGQASSQFGVSVGSAGDVNGDGYSDVVVGANAYDNGEADEGAAFLYLGSASGTSASADWTAESNQATAYFGTSAKTAGDVNGDGYSDVIVGTPWHNNGQSIEGGAFVYYGNCGQGTALSPRQYRVGSGEFVSPLGRSDGDDSFRIALNGRTPFGAAKFRLEWEAKPLGTPFDGAGTGISDTWTYSGTSGFSKDENVAGLFMGTCYHWRARLLYDPATTPFQQKSRWLSISWNGKQETDLRTPLGNADLSVSQADSPDPVMINGGNVTYTIIISNAGPYKADALLSDTIPAGAAFVSANPSQGFCSYSAGVVSCTLGGIEPEEGASVEVVVTLPSVGSHTNHAAVTSNSPDDNTANNSSDEVTTVNSPAIGNFVWQDLDGDGIQDAGEPGMPGIVVQLYDDTYAWLAQKVTDPSGHYSFTGLTFNKAYFVKFFLPPGDYSFSHQDSGTDDGLDSDVNLSTGQTPVFHVIDGLDPTRWDAGIVFNTGCEAPDEPVWIYLVVPSDPDEYPTLNIQDPNQPAAVTGYNVYRTDTPALPKSEWPMIASNVVDMDAGTANIQWTDTSGDPGTWYYQVTAYNAYCPAEGPF